MILAIESSCDETSAAIVEGRRVFANIVSSQVDLHRQWGGVVPEAAARAHVEAIVPVVAEAFTRSGRSPEDVGAVAVTNRPGLVGALAVGVAAAKAWAFALDVPILGVHHLEGHLLSPLAELGGTPIDLNFPHLCLIVSGGHTEIVEVLAPGDYRLLSETIDDAAGEAFDKSARLLGLGYPGGRAIELAAEGGRSDRYRLPRALADDPFRFSFSGLKTAVLRLVETEGDHLSIPDAAASIQAAIVDVLVEKSIRLVEETKLTGLTLVGGVAANAALRETLASRCERSGIAFSTPPIELCTDNAAMIGIAASLRWASGHEDDLLLDVTSSASLPSWKLS